LKSALNYGYIYTHIDLFEEEKIFDPSVAKKTSFSAGRHENKGKRHFSFVFRILLQIQIQLLDFENPKNLKIDSSNCTVRVCTICLIRV
jgi:hypothetical protein